MKKILFFTLVVVLVVSFSIIGGCKEEIATTEDQPEEAVSEETKEEAEEQVEPVKLVYWDYLTEVEPLAEIISESIDEWNANNPNIQVEVSWVGRESITKLRTALISGDIPDIISHSTDELHPSIVAEGLAVSIDEYLDTPAYDQSTSWRNSFNEGALTPYNDGRYYVAPEGFYTSGLFYNISLFDEFNLEPPTTWEELMSVCETLKSGGAIPIVTNGAYSFFPGWYYILLSSRIVGPEEVRAAALDETGLAWQDPGFLDAAKKVQELVDNGYFQEGYDGTNWPGAENLFAEGRTGMYLTGSWFSAEISDKVDDDFQMNIIAFPRISEGNGILAAEAWSNGLVILNESENIDQAIEFLKFMTSKEEQMKYSEVFTPASAKGIELPKYTSGQIKILDEAEIVVPRLHGLQADNPEWITTVYWPTMDQLIFGQISAEQFISSLITNQIEFFQK